MPDIFISKNKPTGKKTINNESHSSFRSKLRTAFSGFVVLPDDVHFENQADGEDVLLLLRQHWITNLHWIIISLVLFLAPIFIFPALSFLKIFNFLPIRFQLVGGIAWYVVIFSYIFISYLSWYFNVYIVTNLRVIDVDFYNLLYKEVSTCEIDKIQDVTYKISGAIGIFFDYGYVYIQTAGEQQNIEFESIPKPAMVAKKLTELMETRKK